MKKKKNDHNVNIDFKMIFSGKKMPLLTLDQRWHTLFPEYNKPENIKLIESKINALIKQQGKIATDMKEMKQNKNKLMQEIITHMDVSDTKEGRVKAKLLEKNQKTIKEISSKMKSMEDEIVDLPYQIKEMNEKLIVESSIVCYERLTNNQQKVEILKEEIEQLKDELKDKILEKQDMEMKSTEIYSYMHDMFGPEILQKLDENLK